MDGPDMGFVRGVIALVSIATFLGICWWAYRPRNRARFEGDAMLVFDREEEKARARAAAEKNEGNEGEEEESR